MSTDHPRRTASRRLSGFLVRPGDPTRLGAVVGPDGIRFAVLATPGAEVTLVLFDRTSGHRLGDLPIPATYRHGRVHAIEVLDLDPDTLDYGYRVRDPRHGGRVLPEDPDAVLLDPYATAVSETGPWGAPHLFRSRIDTTAFDWADDSPPALPVSDLVIYELHVRGFTKHPSSGVHAPGTFAGLRERIPYLSWLGVNCVELLPIAPFDETANTFDSPSGHPLLDYWGYNPLVFGAPKPGYADGDPAVELRELVRDLHAAGIELILDVVFNHTGEGGDHGRALSLRGFAEGIYYQLDSQGRHRNLTATGNTVNCNHPVVRELILESLRHWVTEYHVDGFRFDMAPILARQPSGEPSEAAPLLREIAADPILRDRKLIAEPWDATGLDYSGRFTHHGWMEWNGRFRDAVRRFLLGRPGSARELASGMAGSPDQFGTIGPAASVNHVTCHDGFTLADWAAHDQPHNLDNGEDGRDGIRHNHSHNHGVEGASRDPRVAMLRSRQVRNALCLTLLGHGVPMLLAGDEFGRSQRGNNNPYGQDNELAWVDWRAAEENADLLEFVRRCIAFRAAHPVLRARHAPVQEAAEAQDGSPPSHHAVISWHGARPWQPDWSPTSGLVAQLCHQRQPNGADDAILLVANGRRGMRHLLPPEPPPGTRWHAFVDTAAPSGYDAHSPGSEPPLGRPGEGIWVRPRSVRVLTAR